MPRILLVEDDDDVRLLIEHTLIDAGHEVHAAGTMLAGLARIIQRGAMRPHDDTGGGVVFCGVEDAGIGV